MQIALPEETPGSGAEILRILAGGERPATGTIWWRTTPDRNRPFLQENIELSRHRKTWRARTGFVPSQLSGFQKFRYGKYEKMLQAVCDKRPPLLLIEAPQPAQQEALRLFLPALLDSRRKSGLTTLITCPDLLTLPLFDHVAWFSAGKLQFFDTPERFAAQFKGAMFVISAGDMSRLESDLADLPGLIRFYHNGDHFRVHLGSDHTSGHSAGAGISVMSLTAWLAIKDHQQIVVQPAMPELRDWNISTM